MKSSRVEVTYASKMKPNDMYAGNVNQDAPTMPVQVFAAAHRITGIIPYDDGRKMLHLEAGKFALEPIPASSQVLLIREGEPAPDQVARYLAQHGTPASLPAGAGESPDPAQDGIVLTREQVREWAGLGRDLTDDELGQIDDCIPQSSIPEAIATIATEALQLTAADDEEPDDDQEAEETAAR